MNFFQWAIIKRETDSTRTASGKTDIKSGKMITMNGQRSTTNGRKNTMIQQTSTTSTTKGQTVLRMSRQVLWVLRVR